MILIFICHCKNCVKHVPFVSGERDIQLCAGWFNHWRCVNTRLPRGNTCLDWKPFKCQIKAASHLAWHGNLFVLTCFKLFSWTQVSLFNSIGCSFSESLYETWTLTLPFNYLNDVRENLMVHMAWIVLRFQLLFNGLMCDGFLYATYSPIHDIVQVHWLAKNTLEVLQFSPLSAFVCVFLLIVSLETGRNSFRQTRWLKDYLPRLLFMSLQRGGSHFSSLASLSGIHQRQM
jgi:hypothetical protein